MRSFVALVDVAELRVGLEVFADDRHELVEVVVARDLVVRRVS